LSHGNLPCKIKNFATLDILNKNHKRKFGGEEPIVGEPLKKEPHNNRLI
jgi:hypothetical protein